MDTNFTVAGKQETTYNKRRSTLNHCFGMGNSNTSILKNWDGVDRGDGSGETIKG